ncbi:MAG: carboxypeptidase regulatory-like domain-containing protein [Planctomycetes bacterium]|nr:carboxypeptidase regulatory-like domain-containing protein [Planctomycetota bacterium]
MKNGQVSTAMWVLVAIVALVGGAWLLLTPDAGPSVDPLPERTAVPEEVVHRPNMPTGPAIAPVPFDPKADRDASSAALEGEDTGVKLNGLVTDPAGHGIANALVELVQDLSALKSRFQEGDVLAKLRTGRDGDFRFENLVPGDIYVVRASHVDWTTDREHPIDASDTATLQPVLVLERGFNVSGRVTGSGGEPLHGATVEVHDLGVQTYEPVVPPERSGTSGVDGRYTVSHASAGLKKLIVRCKGRAMDGRNAIDLRADVSDVDFVLDTGLRISGVVLDAVSRRPVPNAIITARPLNFLITAAPSSEGERGEDDGRDDDMRVRESVRRVAAGLKPTENAAEVNAGRQLQPQAIQQKAFLLGDARSDDQGVFVLDGLLSARYLLVVRARGYQPNNGFAADAGAEAVELTLQPSASISGRVVDGTTGEPVARFSVALGAGPDPAFITAQMRQRFNNANGEFTYVDARPGTVVLIAESDGFAGGRSDPMNITSDQRIDGVIVRLEKGAAVSGLVTGSDGKPVAGARLSLGNFANAIPDNPFTKVLSEQLRSASRKRAVSAADGTWQIAGVLAGSYKISAEHNDYSAAESGEISCDGRSAVAVPTLLMARGGTLKGTVKGKDGLPDPQATVMVSSADVGVMWSRSITTNSEGTYEVRGLKPGNYRLIATQRQGQVDLLAILKRAQDPGSMVYVGDGEVRVFDL